MSHFAPIGLEFLKPLAPEDMRVMIEEDTRRGVDLEVMPSVAKLDDAAIRQRAVAAIRPR